MAQCLRALGAGLGPRRIARPEVSYPCMDLETFSQIGRRGQETRAGRGAGLVVALAAFFQVTSTGLGIDDSHAGHGIREYCRLQEAKVGRTSARPLEYLRAYHPADCKRPRSVALPHALRSTSGRATQPAARDQGRWRFRTHFGVPQGVPPNAVSYAAANFVFSRCTARRCSALADWILGSPGGFS